MILLLFFGCVGQAHDQNIHAGHGDARHVLDRLLDVLLHLFAQGHDLAAVHNGEVHRDGGNAVLHDDGDRLLQAGAAQKRADVLAGAGGYIGNTVNLQRGQTRNFCDNLGRDL